MEPAGLTIGAIALASLFTECIECLDLIELARSSEKGLKTQVCKLSIIRRQFMVWGESIGLLSPDEGRDDVLDQVEGRQEIEDVLQQISILLQDAEKLKTQYGVEVDNTDGKQSDCIDVSRRRRDIFMQHPIVEFMCRLTAHQRRSTIISKTRWAIRDSKNLKLLSKTWIGLSPSSSQLMSRMRPIFAGKWLPAKRSNPLSIYPLCLLWSRPAEAPAEAGPQPQEFTVTTSRVLVLSSREINEFEIGMPILRVLRVIAKASAWMKGRGNDKYMNPYHLHHGQVSYGLTHHHFNSQKNQVCCALQPMVTD